MTHPTNPTHTYQQLHEEMNRNQVELIRVDLETSITFASIALAASEAESDKRERNTRNAHRGYDTICHLLETAEVSGAERREIVKRSTKLKEMLEALGADLSVRTHRDE